MNDKPINGNPITFPITVMGVKKWRCRCGNMLFELRDDSLILCSRCAWPASRIHVEVPHEKPA